MQVYAIGTLGTLGVRGFFKHSCRTGECCRTFWEELEGRMPRGVGYLSIYSKKDGIVDWRACLDPSAAHLEVEASHIGMAVNPDAYRAVAGALAAFRGDAAPRAVLDLSGVRRAVSDAA
jgi:hypothetical protein